MPKLPLKTSYPMTQDWNDPRYRSSYTRFGLLGHNGQDFGVPVGTEIIAPHEGKIIEAGLDSGGYGWYVKIENRVEGSILGHFREEAKVNVGDEVVQGQLIGISGNSGNSTGPHLHWGYYRFPRKRDNGFSGTVDQTHWININSNLDIEKELDEMRLSRDKWKKEASDQAKKIDSLVEQIESMQKSNAELTAQLSLSNKTNKEMIDTLNERILTLTNEKNSIVEHCSSLQSGIDIMTSQQDKNKEKLTKLQLQVEKLEKLANTNIMGHSWWVRFISLFKRG